MPVFQGYLPPHATLPTYVLQVKSVKLRKKLVRVFVRTRAPLVNTHPSTHKRAATNRLWRYRKERQLSQRHIARLLGHRTGAQVSRWESGEKVPTLDNALLLAHILDIPVESLFAERTAELRTRLDQRAGKRIGG